MMSPPAGKRDLPLALAALSQMVGHASLLQSDLDDERKIILEEWRGKLGVAERMHQQRVQAIRQGSRYPDRPVIGTQATINTMHATLLQDFYQRWYHPSNMRLTVIGDIVPQEVAAEIARQFGALPAFLSKTVMLGGLMQIRSAFAQVHGALSWFIHMYVEITMLSASIQRLIQFKQKIDRHQPQQAAPDVGEYLNIENLSFATPQGTLERVGLGEWIVWLSDITGIVSFPVVNSSGWPSRAR